VKLSLIEIDGEPIVWANKSKPATLMGKVSVMGVLPFVAIVLAPYAIVFYIALTNFLLDIYKQRVRALRWADVFRRYRTLLNGGYWYCQSRHQVRQTKRSWDHFKGIRHW
jgi:hypothetical protein